jgi:hypothetical protein
MDMLFSEPGLAVCRRLLGHARIRTEQDSRHTHYQDGRFRELQSSRINAKNWIAFRHARILHNGFVKFSI